MAKGKTPQFVWRRRAVVLKAIDRLMAEGESCNRCGGHGFLDREDWVETEDDGAKACFKCKGTGLARRKRYPEPLKVRMAVAYELLPLVREGDFHSIMEKEDEERGRVYWPVLVDVFQRAMAAAERVAGV